ncbi:hypothetical protein N1031_07440 [Herbiconiux moechotypicola]|uniref:Right handed beta helix domain-containing protein n=1 Tax=Herbiconiux moechotypicola TaxID=637393 RepID=A0ABN3DH78_9MICO|nr:right-handed parallel beta-helix repeat-containing protein [Herbiconiux moechotypicola]MCS5729591.1 hypothetical protein [Herbiconiux moechotypicola]
MSADDEPDARGADAGGPTAEERGDTLGRGPRALVRVAVAAVFVVALVAVVLVVNGVPHRVSQFVGGIVSAASGADSATVGPTASASAVPSASASAVPSGSASAAPSAPANAVPSASATAAATAPTPTPTAGAPAISGDQALIDAAHAVEATLRPGTTQEPYPVDADDLHQAELVQANDTRWALLSRGLGLDAGAVGTIVVLPAIDRAYTLTDLIERGAVTRVDDATFLVGKTVFVARGATLDLQGAGQTLRLSSGASGFSPLVVWGGTLKLGGAEGAPLAITSWDTAADAPDTTVADGRAYIRVNEGTVAIDRVGLSDLGFWSGRTGGLALTGSSSWASTGSIANTTIDRDHVGLYVESAAKVRLGSSVVSDSVRAGVLVGSDVVTVDIADSTVRGSGASGVDVRQGAYDVSVTGSTLSGNAHYGLEVDGSPRAEGASAGGFTPENSWGLEVSGDTFTGNGKGGATVTGMSDVAFDDVAIDERRSGLVLTDSQGSIADSTVEVDSGDGIVLAGPLTSVTVSGTTVTGTGPSAIAVRDGADDVTRTGNDTSGWTERWQALMWLEAHPLALLWGLLLVIPVLGFAFVFYRARRQRRIRELVEAATIALAARDVARYEAGRGDDVSGPEDTEAGREPAAGHERLDPLDEAVDQWARELHQAAGGAPDVGSEATATHDAADEDSEPVHGVPLRGPRRRVPKSPARTTARYAPVQNETWLLGGPLSARDHGVGETARPPGAARAGGASPTGQPVSGRSSAAPAMTSSRADGEAAAVRPAQPRPAPMVAHTSIGRFSSVEELAVTAVLDAGKPVDRVAAALRVPVGTVAGWVAKARRARGE